MAVYVGDLFMELGSVSYYSPQFARGGMAISIQFNIFALSAGVTNLTISIEHKNLEDTSWTALSTAAYTTTGLQAPLTGSNVKEVVRIKYIVNATNEYDAVFCNTLAPVWQPYT